jgi:hypothetical protein
MRRRSTNWRDAFRFAGRPKAKALSPVLPKPTYSNVAGQVPLIDPRLGPRWGIRLAPARALTQARVGGAAPSISPNPALSYPGVASLEALRLLWRTVYRPSGPQGPDFCSIARPPGRERVRRLIRPGAPTWPTRPPVPSRRSLGTWTAREVEHFDRTAQ